MKKAMVKIFLNLNTFFVMTGNVKMYIMYIKQLLLNNKQIYPSINPPLGVVKYIDGERILILVKFTGVSKFITL